YSRSDRARLKLILRGRRLGFSLQDMKKMIDLYNPDRGATEQLNFTLRKCEEQLEKLVAQRKDINDAISELEEGIADLRHHLSSNSDDMNSKNKKLA
ncbi:MAG: MerR family DNA-binding protein, partial [Sneathiella sp.]|nr:MerR family DNA-binding protein [Sneathiella sp.]